MFIIINSTSCLGCWPGSEPRWTCLLPEKEKQTNAVTNLHHVYYCYASCATSTDQTKYIHPNVSLI